MPVFTYRCPECGNEEKKLRKKDVEEFCGICENTMLRQLPSDLNASTMEMRDKHRGVQLPKDHEKRMRKRMIEHQNKYELAERIDKYGIDDADRNGWTKNIKKT